MIVPPDVFTTMTYTITFTRVIDNIIVPSELKLIIDFEPHDEITDDELDKSLGKIKYWMENIVSRSLVFCRDNEAAVNMFVDDHGNPRSGNVILLTPDEPDDPHLAALIQAKLSALSGHLIDFGPIEVQSSHNQYGLGFTFSGDALSILPGIKDWIGERSYFADPWWNRDDGSTMDLIPEEGADLSIRPPWAFEFRVKTPEINKEPTVIRPRFSPTIISGGKEED